MFYPVSFHFGFSRSDPYHRLTTFVPITCVPALREYETPPTRLHPVDIQPVEGKVGSPLATGRARAKKHGDCGARQELVHRVYSTLFLETDFLT